MNKAIVGVLAVALYLYSYLAEARRPNTVIDYQKWKEQEDAKQKKHFEKLQRTDQDEANNALLTNLQSSLYTSGLSDAQKRHIYGAITSLKIAATVNDVYFKKAAYNDALGTFISVLSS
ncbi:PREDICTED: uncharacterized protein LOC108972530 [Bactrocera latifrons]|uniref:Uncharacterized protein n=1 Tax=Bactrocera latifrons TaxID=174628 RepID=A0A0K8W9W4_BACLA|nr:PREDICTED: uncharacterized protein LOC108972530 [Bactrocera latifrons]